MRVRECACMHVRLHVCVVCVRASCAYHVCSCVCLCVCIFDQICVFVCNNLNFIDTAIIDLETEYLIFILQF